MANGLRLRLRFIFSLIMILSIMTCASAQSRTYYVQLKDKKGSTYSIDHPEDFLSPKAIERRQRQGIAISDNDLPVTASYLQQIGSICHIASALRWTNGVIVRSDDASAVALLRALPFVTDVRVINGGGPSTRNKILDHISPLKKEGTLMDTTWYGAATRQTRMIHVDRLHELGYWGEGVIIAIMDAGFLSADGNRFMQPSFDAGKVLYTWNFVFDTSDVYGVPRANPHGEETFSCIAANRPHEMVGTAPQASFMLFQTEDNRSETVAEEYYWAAAAERADSMGAEVFSTSLGYTTFDDSDSADSHTYADMTGHTTVIAKAANTAASKGIIVVNSAGNDGANAWHYIATPGDADSGATIGAVTPDGYVANFSSRGPNFSGQIKPDVCAQGAPAALINTAGSVSAASGTSFSCPITAGAFACLRQAFPSAPNMVLLQVVRSSATRFTTPDANFGYGVPDFGDAYDKLKVLYPQDTLTYINSTRVYPNPFSTTLTIIMTDMLRDSINSVEMYDLAGHRLWSDSIHTTEFTNNVWEVTPPASLARGVYILSINKTRKYRLVKGN